ncbi:MAG: quinolinate synthase NadA [Bacteriovoracaceae bacterium]|jgi:quinolinate synthase|nr:quinolinate synthase NadA [Bacteriovoracaceae bacterium]
MLDLFGQKKNDFLPEISEEELSDQEVMSELKQLKQELREDLLILGHHYQQNDVISFADITGDSLALAKHAANTNMPYIVFCGVHFMAETADMLTRPDQQVILPDLNAGCSMADMANNEQVEKAWEVLVNASSQKIIPITYINCDAKLKAFVGRNDGAICTSSNAEDLIKWAFDQGEKLLFFPDQHLGRNTCSKLGIKLDEMIVYNPNMQNGGVTTRQIKDAKVILWHGYCSVHQGFTAEQVLAIKKDSPQTRVIVHPECSYEVFEAADDAGSTSYIIDKIEQAPAGTSFAVGTEINLVNRLNDKYADKQIKSLSPYQCLCTTMYRVRPRWLLASLRAIKIGKPINVIKVDNETRKYGLLALERMLRKSK